MCLRCLLTRPRVSGLEQVGARPDRNALRPGPTYVIRGQVGVIPLYAVVQDGDHHVLPRVASLPRRLDVHLRSTATVSVTAMLCGQGTRSADRDSLDPDRMPRAPPLPGRVRAGLQMLFLHLPICLSFSRDVTPSGLCPGAHLTVPFIPQPVSNCSPAQRDPPKNFCTVFKTHKQACAPTRGESAGFALKTSMSGVSG